jgi:MFS family permease
VPGDDGRGLQFGSLYLTRFAASLGATTLLTLLPFYVNVLNPSGIVVGLFTTALTLAATVAVIPLGYAGDRYDKRTVLLAGLAVAVAAYAAFPFVETSLGFVAARTLQGFSIVGTGLLSLALVGELAPADARANRIGRYNAARMAAGVVGTLGSAAAYRAFGFGPIFAVLAGLLLVAFVGVLLFIDPDDTTVAEFAFFDFAVNRRILTLTSFRAQYAVGVTLVRTWVGIYVGVEAARGGLAFAPFAVGAVLAAEKLTNMVCQPFTGRLSDGHGRALFVFAGGGAYGLVALAIPFGPAIGTALGLPTDYPLVGTVTAAFLPLVALNGLLGVADAFREPASMALFADEGSGGGIASSFSVRNLVWRPGSVLAPLLGGVLMDVDMALVFFVGGAAAITGALTFLGVLVYSHGSGALTEW